jgi:hypothetical protein
MFEWLAQENLAKVQKVAGHYGTGVVEKKAEAECAEEQHKVMKKLAEMVGGELSGDLGKAIVLICE